MAAAENENARDLRTDEERELMRALNGYARAVAKACQDEANASLALLHHYQARTAAWQPVLFGACSFSYCVMLQFNLN